MFGYARYPDKDGFEKYLNEVNHYLEEGEPEYVGSYDVDVDNLQISISKKEPEYGIEETIFSMT